MLYAFGFVLFITVLGLTCFLDPLAHPHSTVELASYNSLLYHQRDFCFLWIPLSLRCYLRDFTCKLSVAMGASPAPVSRQTVRKLSKATWTRFKSH